MSEQIQDFEKIYINDYLNERKEDIFNLLRTYKISYFKIDFGRSVFFDGNGEITLRVFYASENKYVSIDEYTDECLYDGYKNERLRLNFNGLNSKKLWIDGDYFKFIVSSILSLKDLPIEVR